MNTENELFGELHEQEENGLFGNEHKRQYEAQQEALYISAVSNSFCDLNPDFQQYLIEQGEKKCNQCGKNLKAK